MRGVGASLERLAAETDGGGLAEAGVMVAEAGGRPSAGAGGR